MEPISNIINQGRGGRLLLAHQISQLIEKELMIRPNVIVRTKIILVRTDSAETAFAAKLLADKITELLTGYGVGGVYKLRFESYSQTDLNSIT